MSETIQSIIEQIKLLKSIDKSFAVLGSSDHKYQLNSPIPINEVETLEEKYCITFPTEYRDFITKIGNGGAGPGYYGLLPLDDFEYLSLSRESFPFETIKSAESFEHSQAGLGSLILADYGCGVSAYLIMNGKFTGDVWIHDPNCDLFQPFNSLSGLHCDGDFRDEDLIRHFTFSVWFNHWLENSIALARLTSA